jgi:hypothetical protein
MVKRLNVARTYRSADRLCARPGCGAPATATLRFQSTLREAWLVAIDRTGPRTEGDLCTRHAQALVLPRGWLLHDERPQIHLVSAERPEPEPEPVEPTKDDDLDQLLDARTPLLQRAFSNVRSAG